MNKQNKHNLKIIHRIIFRWQKLSNKKKLRRKNVIIKIIGYISESKPNNKLKGLRRKKNFKNFRRKVLD